MTCKHARVMWRQKATGRCALSRLPVTHVSIRSLCVRMYFHLRISFSLILFILPCRIYIFPFLYTPVHCCFFCSHAVTIAHCLGIIALPVITLIKPCNLPRREAATQKLLFQANLIYVVKRGSRRKLTKYNCVPSLVKTGSITRIATSTFENNAERRVLFDRKAKQNVFATQSNI